MCNFQIKCPNQISIEPWCFYDDIWIFFEYTKILLTFEQHFRFEPNQYFLVH
jgi:hypothetical protein